MTNPFTIAQPTANFVDPYMTTERRANLGIRFSVFESLITRDTGSMFVPALATKWDVDSDARTWTFSLRDKVLFHDGEQFSAWHVAESIERILNPERVGELGTTGVIQAYLTGARVTVITKQTIRIETVEPMADLLDILVELPISSATLAGTGPYTVEAVDSDHVEMKAFPHYWGPPPSYARLRWISMPDAAERQRSLIAGDVDLITDVPTHHTSAIGDSPGVTMTTHWSPTCVAFLCNCFDGPCTDARVRQALNLGLDIHALIRDVTDGDAQPINGPLTPDHFAYEPSVPPYPWDPETAKRLLDRAGHGSGLDLILDVPTRLPEEAPALARAMAAQWESLGVQTTIRLHHDREEYANAVRTKAIGDAACFDSSPLSSFRVLREKLHSRIAGPWWQGYENRMVDSLLDQATITVDTSARQSLYRNAYRLIRDDAPWVFLYRPANRWASRSGARWRPSPAGWIDMR